MVVPRRRSTLSPPIEPSKDTTPTEVVFEDEGNDADVIEQIGGKTVSYSAKVKKKDETKDQEQDFSNENTDRFVEEPPAPTIPKSPLDYLFDDINYCVEMEGAYDSFIANLLREPDQITDKFNVPCREFADVGAFSFSSVDRYRFAEAIQDANENSGGRFAISILTHDYRTLYTWRNRSEAQRQVVAKLVVKNPKPKPLIENNGNQLEGGMASVLSRMIEIQQANHNQLMQVINRQPEKSELESMLMAAMVQKFSNDLVNPPQGNGNNSVEGTMARVMENVAVTQAMAEGFARIINREPAAEKESDIFDKIGKVTELPMVKEITGRIMDIADAAVIKNLQLNETVPGADTAANPHSENNTMTEQQELITTVLTELESENALNAENQTIQELSEDFPDELSDLIVTCKTAPFETVFSLLLNRAGKMQPFPFTQYLNVEETQKEQRYIWNESGEKIIVRLRELYDYLKTVQ